MRETIASTWVYQLVIVFILIFVAFLILSLTYSKNYKTKNEIINVIEKYEGVNTKSIQIINNYLSYNGYKVKGSCPTGDMWVGVESLDSVKVSKTQSGTKYYYCIHKVYANKKASTKTQSGVSVKSKMFYQVKIFFKFNLPVIGNIYTFNVDGTTNDIFQGNDAFIEQGIEKVVK